MIKFETELHKALTIVPDSTSFVEVIFPPILASSSTKMVAIPAPAKAPNDKPSCKTSAEPPKPTKMAKVAPKDAPEEIPKI